MAMTRRKLLLGGAAAVAGVSGVAGTGLGVNIGVAGSQEYEADMSELARMETLRTLADGLSERDITQVLDAFEAHKAAFKAMSPKQLDEWISSQRSPSFSPSPRSFAEREENKPEPGKESYLG